MSTVTKNSLLATLLILGCGPLNESGILDDDVNEIFSIEVIRNQDSLELKASEETPNSVTPKQFLNITGKAKLENKLTAVAENETTVILESYQITFRAESKAGQEWLCNTTTPPQKKLNIKIHEPLCQPAATSQSTNIKELKTLNVEESQNW